MHDKKITPSESNTTRKKHSFGAIFARHAQRRPPATPHAYVHTPACWPPAAGRQMQTSEQVH